MIQGEKNGEYVNMRMYGWSLFNGRMFNGHMFIGHMFNGCSMVICPNPMFERKILKNSII